MNAEITRKWIEKIVCTFTSLEYASYIINQCDEELKELEAKAAKWDMIQWALDNAICFVWNGESRRVWLDESDLIDLERQYKEREQDGR